jgi:hypothetical protein
MKWKKRQYKIAHYPSMHEWAIFRERNGDIQWLSSDMIWTREKRRAMRFISESDAESTFIKIKMSWELKTEEEYLEEVLKENEALKPKQYWGEFS